MVSLSLFVFFLAIVAGLLVVPLLALVRATRALREIDELRRAIRAEPPPAAADRASSAPPAPPPAPVMPAPVVPVAAVPAPSAAVPVIPVDESARAAAGAAEPGRAVEPPAGESLEVRIGGRWLLYLGVSAIVIAAAYFVKLAFESAWITETMRVVIGGLAGLALVWAGGRFARRGYPLYGQMLAGGGIAILYLSGYAAFNFYALVGRMTAFGLMALVTAFAAWLADSHRSQGLALMAVGGGFFTPFMIGGEVDAQAALFGYDAILVAGTAVLARRRDWPGLNLLGYILTVVTVVAWFGQFYRDAVYLRTVLFLTLFCAMFGYLLARTWRSERPLAGIVRAVLATAPPAYYVTSIVLLYGHPLAFLIFLVGATLAGLVVARQLDAAWGRLLLWVVVAWPLAFWIAGDSGSSWRGASLVVALAIHVLHLLTQLEIVQREERPLRAPDVLLLHLSGLGLFGLIDLLIGGRGVLMLAGAAAALAAVNTGLAVAGARLRPEVRLHFGALAATLGVVAIGLWSGGAWTLLGLGVEAAALVAIGLRTGREWLRLGGSLLLGLAVLWFSGLAFLPVATSYTFLANARSAAAAVLLVLFYGLAIMHRRATGDGTARAQRDSDVFVLALNAVLFVAVTAEINGFWELRGGGRPPELSQMASLAIAWTLQAAGVIRVGLSRRREWLRAAGALLLVVPVLWVGVSSLWAEVLVGARPPQGYVIFVNARAAAALVIIVVLCGLAAMHRRAGPPHAGLPMALAILTASVVTLGLLSAEASAFWYLRDASGGDPRRAFHFARELTLSVLWAAYAAALVGAGIQRRYAPIRYFAIALFLVTILKVAVVDLAELERLYRVLSVMALGLLLLLASYLYQRFSARLDHLEGDRRSPAVGNPRPPIV